MALGGGGRRIRVGRVELGGADERSGLKRNRLELTGGGPIGAAAAGAAAAVAPPLLSSPLESTLDP